MNILITGINGFIGRHLAAELIKNTNSKVIGVSRSPSLFSSSNYIHIKADISHDTWFKKIDSDVDVVIHLAQSKDYRQFPEKTNEVIQTNIMATGSLLNWCKKKRIKKFIFASSGNVYRQKRKALKEDDICEPSTFYGATKLCGELLVQQYRKYFDIIILRLFGIYGKDQRDMLIPNIFDSIKKGNKVQLVNKKSLYLTPLFIDDCVSMLKEVIFNKRKSEVYNVSGNETVDLESIIKALSMKLDIKPNIEYVSGKIKYFTGSNKLFMRDYKFKRKLIPFVKGIDSLC